MKKFNCKLHCLKFIISRVWDRKKNSSLNGKKKVPWNFILTQISRQLKLFQNDRMINVAVNKKGFSWPENEHCTADCHPSEFSNWRRPLSNTQSHVNVAFVGLSCAERADDIGRHVVVQLWKGSAYSWALSKVPKLLRVTTNTRPVAFMVTAFEWWNLGNKSPVRDFRLPYQCKWDIRSSRFLHNTGC